MQLHRAGIDIHASIPCICVCVHTLKRQSIMVMTIVIMQSGTNMGA